jgi:transcription elongation factor GreA
MKARLIKRFEDEIVILEHELQVDLPKEIKRARELGDLRENAEYSAAKERQRFVETRISMLRTRVSQIQLMNLDRIPKGKAGFGSRLTVKENGREFVLELVMPEDADPDRGLVSVASPIGRALVGKQAGDEVSGRWSGSRPATRSPCRRRRAAATSRSSDWSPSTTSRSRERSVVLTPAPHSGGTLRRRNGRRLSGGRAAGVDGGRTQD